MSTNPNPVRKKKREWRAFILVNPMGQYVGELYGSRDAAECALCGDETVVEVRITEQFKRGNAWAWSVDPWSRIITAIVEK